MTFDATTAARCRADFPALGRRLDDGTPLAFLDGPAGTQVPTAVIDAVAAYYRRSNANTHGCFATSEETDAMLADARAAVAALLGAEGPERVSFGANMTTLTFALARAVGRSLDAGDEVVITQLDHEANRGPWLRLAERGVTVTEVRLRTDGRLDADHMAAVVGPRTRLMALGASSNALGTVNDLALARRLTREVGAALVIDAVHYAPHFPIDVVALGADALLCSAYKFYGPHVGLLYTRPGWLEALDTDVLRTQEQDAPYRIETGTLNHAAIAGVGAAVRYLADLGRGETLRARLVDAVSSIAGYEHGLARRYAERVATLPGVTVWGPSFDDPGPRAPTVSITVDHEHPTELAERLGRRGLCVWDGDFYAARPVEVLGLAARGGLLRTGISLYNTDDEIDRLVAALAR